jgi:hypothetical protein
MASKAVIIGGASAALVTGAAAAIAYNRLANGVSVVQSVNDGASAIARAPVAAAGAVVASVDPLRRNTGPVATQAQKLAWCAKVNRTQGVVGIREVPRVRTLASMGGAFPTDLRGFARFAGEGLDVGIRGGTVLAVLYSFETNAGRSANAACWNNNYGNFKLYREQWHAPETPLCYFLVDNAVISRDPLRFGSLDYYPSFSEPQAGLAAWGSTTFLNRRYMSHGDSREALRTGNIRRFCQIIGAGGYADSYRASPRAMDARAKLLAGLAPYTSYRSVIDGANLYFDPSL